MDETRGCSSLDSPGTAQGLHTKAPSKPYPPKPDQDTSADPPKKDLSFYLSFFALNVTVFIVSLDITALTVAIPRITDSLHGSTLEAFWTNMSFILAVVVTQPIYTSISDVLGRKIPLYASFFFFFVGSIVFAIASRMDVLIVGRILQGIGGGGLDVLGEVILADITTLKERPLYLGLFALPMAGGGICGPLIGAAFSEYVNWRWIGWMNLPIIAVGVLLALFFLHLRPIQRSFQSKLSRIDWIGFCLFTLGCTTFSLPLSWADEIYPWSSWRTILPLTIGSVVLAAFAVYEKYPAEPMFPYRIFSNLTAVIALLGASIHGVILYSVLLYAPLFFQAVYLEDAFPSAVSVLATGVCIVAFSVIGAVAIEIIRKYKMLIVFSWALAAVGLGLWALWHSDSSAGLRYGVQVLAGVGIGTLFIVLTIPMQAAVQNVEDMGLAAGMTVSFRLFGGLVGLAISSTVFNSLLQREVSRLQPLPSDVAEVGDVHKAIAFIPVLKTLDPRQSVRTQVVEAYRVAFTSVFLMLAGFAVLGFLTSFLMRELTLEKKDLGRQRLEKER